MTAVLFSIAELESGRGIGRAVICVKARYASVQWRDIDLLERRFGNPTLWRSVQADLLPGFDVGPLPATGGIVRLLLDPGRRRSLVVQYVSATAIVAAPGVGFSALDRLLQETDSA